MMWSECEEAERWDIFTAASLGCADTVKLWISSSSDTINSQNSGGWSALMYAAYIGHLEVVDVLVKYPSCNLNISSGDGRTPLILAASCGNQLVVRLLIASGAELNHEDCTGWSALFHAAALGHEDVVKELLVSKARVNHSVPKSGITCLMVAANDGHESIVQLLIEFGCDHMKQSANGETAKSIAQANGFLSIVSILNKYENSMPVDKIPSLVDGPNIANQLLKGKTLSQSQKSRTTSIGTSNTDFRNVTAPVTLTDWLDFDNTYSGEGKEEMPENLHEFLQNLGMEKYIDIFEAEDVDLEVLLSLDEKELKDIGILKVGARRKLVLACSKHQKQKLCAQQNTLLLQKLRNYEQVIHQLETSAKDLSTIISIMKDEYGDIPHLHKLCDWHLQLCNLINVKI